MTPPANSEDGSTPKSVLLCHILSSSLICCRHSSPNDLTGFITQHDPVRDYPVASGGYGSVHKCIYKEGEQSKEVR
jgi:hypothetical protein